MIPIAGITSRSGSIPRCHCLSIKIGLRASQTADILYTRLEVHRVGSSDRSLFILTISCLFLKIWIVLGLAIDTSSRPYIAFACCFFCPAFVAPVRCFCRVPHDISAEEKKKQTRPKEHRRVQRFVVSRIFVQDISRYDSR